MERNNGFEIMEDVTCADIALRIHGTDAGDLFRNAARALLAVMLEDPGDVERRVVKTITLQNESPEILLHAFLDELVFLKDADRLLLFADNVSILEEKGEFRLRCDCSGEAIDRNRHRFHVDVKAVTMHRLAVKRKKAGWTATVVLDV